MSVSLRDLRVAAGLSQGEMAKLVGRRQSWASKVERGALCGLHSVTAYARALGWEVEVQVVCGSQRHTVRGVDPGIDPPLTFGDVAVVEHMLGKGGES